MFCRFCGEDPDAYVLLPRREPNGSLCTMVCLSCAEKLPEYCTKHHVPHLGFTDGTTACQQCIEELVVAHREDAPRWCERIREALTLPLEEDGMDGHEEFQEIVEAAETSSLVTGDDEAIAVLRFIVTKALRLHHSPEQVIEELVVLKSADCILG